MRIYIHLYIYIYIYMCVCVCVCVQQQLIQPQIIVLFFKLFIIFVCLFVIPLWAFPLFNISSDQS